MVKLVRVLARIMLGIVFLNVFALIVAVNYSGPSTGVLGALRDKFCMLANEPYGDGLSLSAGWSAEYCGTCLVFPTLAYSVLLTSLNKKKKSLYVTALVLIIMNILSTLSRHGAPFMPVVMAILLFTNPVRAHFRKQVEPDLPKWDMDDGKFGKP